MVRSTDAHFIILPVGEVDPGLQVPKGEIVLQYVNPSTPRVGFSFSYNVRIKNTGDKASDEFKVVMTLPDGKKFFRTGISLEPDEYTDAGVGNIQITQPGTYEFKAEAYVGQDLTDSKSLSVQVSS